MIEALSELDAARASTPAGTRLRALRLAGEALAERLRDAAPVRRVEVLALDRVPVRAELALDGALRAPVRWMELERRMLFLELESGARVVVDPVEPGSWSRTPWGTWLAEAHPRRARRALQQGRSAGAALASIGVEADTIDVAILTHLRGQDLRALIGTAHGDGVEGPRESMLPRARWIVSATELASAAVPDDLERAHLVRDVRARVAEDRIEAITRDVSLRGSVAVMHAPGLTEGQLGVAVHDARGVFVWSAQGVAVDCWSPYHARLPGLRERVRELDVEAIPRGDAWSRGEALISMALERAVADRRQDAPAMHRVVPSAALCGHPLARPWGDERG
ncbi:hypothetical protein [Sandaracinus amylolyticus]|uniref:Uncharacterized protein n=1 Tax=Sandaracinus amylolyticus TaxID=927083 RepID=A0A0F6YP28_9BACT|nr:hypothetical protein [Sandaracinus amylolyticus]AKF11020.1 hypothetical protein DB32_008169 [Sandaracinus amylolyticus]